MPLFPVPIQNAKRANALQTAQRSLAVIAQSFHPTENPYEERLIPTGSDISNILLALPVKPLVVFEFAGQGACLTAAPDSSAFISKEYVSDMLPKKVSS